MLRKHLNFPRLSIWQTDHHAETHTSIKLMTGARLPVIICNESIY